MNNIFIKNKKQVILGLVLVAVFFVGIVYIPETVKAQIVRSRNCQPLNIEVLPVANTVIDSNIPGAKTIFRFKVTNPTANQSTCQNSLDSLQLHFLTETGQMPFTKWEVGTEDQNGNFTYLPSNSVIASILNEFGSTAVVFRGAGVQSPGSITWGSPISPGQSRIFAIRPSYNAHIVPEMYTVPFIKATNNSNFRVINSPFGQPLTVKGVIQYGI